MFEKKEYNLTRYYLLKKKKPKAVKDREDNIRDLKHMLKRQEAHKAQLQFKLRNLALTKSGYIPLHIENTLDMIDESIANITQEIHNNERQLVEIYKHINTKDGELIDKHSQTR